ncbi:MAG: hypothetical protein ACXWDL_09515 [Nocardioides sp.]
MDHRLYLSARQRVLADLAARSQATPDLVSVLEDAVDARRWWAEQWPEGEIYVAGLVAQDVQDAAIDAGTRWPLCFGCRDAPEHALHIEPDLGGPDPVWVCDESGAAVAELGRLSGSGRAGPTR